LAEPIAFRLLECGVGVVLSPDVAISTSAPRHFPAERALENESRAVAE
jgi:hypothetical protein